jgi:chorismate synthase
MFRYLTAGESHGDNLIAIVEGLPAGLELPKSRIDNELARRQFGYGRSRRMKMEEDRVQILSGLRKQVTIGSPVCLLLPNKASAGWESMPPMTALRPGHADLAGALKYGTGDIRNVLERASARETAMRVCVGTVAKIFCEEMGVRIFSNVTQIGSVKTDSVGRKSRNLQDQIAPILWEIDNSPVRCIDKEASKKMKTAIVKARIKGNTLGGTFEVVAVGVPPGLGSYVHWDRKLDGRLAQAIMSIQAIKGVEIGLGFGYAGRRGSSVHDRITYRDGSFRRTSNNAGGVEGGVTNGEPLVLHAVMKPIPTLRTPLPSVDFITKKRTKAEVQRSDVCAVPAASVVAEAVVAIEIAKALQEKFGADSMKEIKRNFEWYLEQLKQV